MNAAILSLCALVWLTSCRAAPVCPTEPPRAPTERAPCLRKAPPIYCVATDEEAIAYPGTPRCQDVAIPKCNQVEGICPPLGTDVEWAITRYVGAAGIWMALAWSDCGPSGSAASVEANPEGAQKK